jgi:hypothetical protein
MSHIVSHLSCRNFIADNVKIHRQPILPIVNVKNIYVHILKDSKSHQDLFHTCLYDLRDMFSKDYLYVILTRKKHLSVGDTEVEGLGSVLQFAHVKGSDS